MNTLTIRINNDWYAMAGGLVAKGGTKAAARTRLYNATPAIQPAPEVPEAPWVPAMRISEQIAYETKQRQLEAREMGFLPA
jgi:hypothetical protein